MSHVIDIYKDIALCEIHEFDGYYIFMRKDGIMQLLFNPRFNAELKDATNMTATFKKISPDKKAIALVFTRMIIRLQKKPANLLPAKKFVKQLPLTHW